MGRGREVRDSFYDPLVTAIWGSGADEGWRLLSPEPYQAEAVLHDLVEKNPQILPLAGSPRLTILGREVRLGNGYADLLAIEASGRLVIIEVKLASNSESRRAVVAQVLSYAAYLQGLDPFQLESDVLAGNPTSPTSVLAAVEADDQQHSLDPLAFKDGLARSLADGSFRIVIVLDSSPGELVQVVGYLQSITDKVDIDLVTVNYYQLGDSQVLVPHRIEPARRVRELSDAQVSARQAGTISDGSAEFRAAVGEVPYADKAELIRLADWADALAKEGLVKLASFRGKGGITTLLPRLPADEAGLVTIVCDIRSGYMQLWRSVFERRAPLSLPVVEAQLGTELKQGNSTRAFSQSLLDALSNAYREAVGQLPAVMP